MRLIDADALAEEMENAKYGSNASAYAKGCNDVINYYIRQLKEAPTIDPVRHARWVHTGAYVTTAYGHLDVYKCSECATDVTIDDHDNYCPNCGAKMDKEET